MNQERLVRDSRKSQDAHRGFLEFYARQVEKQVRQRSALNVAFHFRRVTEQHFHWHIDRAIAEIPVGDDEIALACKSTDDGDRTAFAFAKGSKILYAVLRDNQHIAFLGLIAPDVHGRHARLGVCNFTQLYLRAKFAVINRFRHSVRQATRANVVNQQDWSLLAHGPAAVDNLLRTPLHLRVAALHRRKIEILARGTACQ